MSFMVLPAGRCGLPTTGLGTGMTSEQSIMLFVFCPITAIFAIAALNDD
jgi:hypothetical protein